MRAMRWCIDRARERKGMAVAAVRDWQLLVAAPYARLAAEAGLVGFACTNFVPLVAPPGGRTAVLGTNPFAYGLPARRHQPVVLDVATSVSSMQKVRVAAQQGTPMPDGVIFDRAGRPITDPGAFLEGGLLAPLGYPHAPHKGFGLALFIDALAGVLSGAGFAQGVAGGAAGSFLWALDVEAFLPRQEFLARMDAQLASRSCWSPASVASDATWTSPAAAWCRWRRRAGSSWRPPARRWPSHCRPPSTTDRRGAPEPAGTSCRAFLQGQGATVYCGSGLRPGGTGVGGSGPSARLRHDRRQAPSGPTRLPVSADLFVGRDGEMEALARLLDDARTRLLTLTGPPGIGKTRLAVAAAAAHAEATGRAAAFVDLVPVRDPDMVTVELARALDVDGRDRADPVDQMAAAVAAQDRVVVLDNCEHLLAAAPSLGRVLAACPGLRVLATSREPLRLSAEQEFPVPPLPLPAAGDVTDLVAVAANPSVALLVDRARRVHPRFALTERNAASVVAACVRLEGLPLALELAAARLKVLSPGELAFRLGHRMELLASRSRDVPARHRVAAQRHHLEP
jgi:hypothetical protein